MQAQVPKAVGAADYLERLRVAMIPDITLQDIITVFGPTAPCQVLVARAGACLALPRCFQGFLGPAQIRAA
jgi:hypothetical protein